MPSNKIDYFGLRTFAQNIAKEVGINSKEKDGLVPATKGQDQPVIYATNDANEPGWISAKQAPYLKEVLNSFPQWENDSYNKIWGSNKDGFVGWMSYQELLSPKAIEEKQYDGIWYYWTQESQTQGNPNVSFYFLELLFDHQDWSSNLVGPGKEATQKEMGDEWGWYTHTNPYTPWAGPVTEWSKIRQGPFMQQGFELDKWNFTYAVEISIPYTRPNNMCPITKSVVKVEGIGNIITNITTKNIYFDFLTGELITKVNRQNTPNLFSYHVLMSHLHQYQQETRDCRFGVSFLNNIDKSVNQNQKGSPFAINFQWAKKKIKVSLLEANNCSIRLFDEIYYPQNNDDSNSMTKFLKFSDSAAGNFIYTNHNFNYNYSSESSESEEEQSIDERNYTNIWVFRNTNSSQINYNPQGDFFFLAIDFFDENKQLKVGNRPWTVKYIITTSLTIPGDGAPEEKKVISEVQVMGIGTDITNYKISNIGFDDSDFNTSINEKIFSYHITMTENSDGLKRHFGISLMNVLFNCDYPAGSTEYPVPNTVRPRTVNIKLLESKNCRAYLHNLLYDKEGNESIFGHYSAYSYTPRKDNFCVSKSGTFNKISTMIAAPTDDDFWTPTTGFGFGGAVPAPMETDLVKFLRGDGTWATPTTYGTMSGATSSSAGKGGLVPTPAAGDQVKFLRGDGTWVELTEFTSATSSQDGVAGLVPAPSSTWYNTQANRFLRADGAWAYHPYAPSSTNYSFVPKAISGTTNLATSAYVLTGAGWKAFTAFDNVQPATAATGTTPGAHGVKGLVPAPNSAWFSTGAKDPNLIYLAGTGTWKWTTNFISDSLTDTSIYKALSAAQGKALAGRFDSSYTVDANSTVSIPIRVNCRALLITVGNSVNTLGLYMLWTNASGIGVIKTITAHTTLTLDLSTAKQLKATAGSAGCRFYFINLSGNNNIHEV